jgi:hypothetical protein
MLATACAQLESNLLWCKYHGDSIVRAVCKYLSRETIPLI